MKTHSVLAIVLIGLTGSAGHAQETGGPTQRSGEAASEEAAPQEERKVCRTEKATGSLTRRTRVCLTAAQWREVNARTYQGVTELQGSASGSQRIQDNRGAGG